ncbi:MAG: BBE domain-containing protein, partial [Micromonosporaceae bacterium]|nr:BBE domain-containing protein [Micromonosporaceae bacterium]
LFWALRGGGGNFGVVTSLELRLYPVDRLWGGMAFYAIERAADTIAYYREWALAEPDEMTTALMLVRMPPDPAVPEPIRGKRVLAIRALYLGTLGDAEWVLEPLLDAAGPPLAGGFRPMSFPETATIAGPPPPSAAVRQHIDLFGHLPDDLIDTLLDSAVDGIEIRHWGGAMARTSPDSGPVGHRHVPFSVVAGARYGDPSDRDPVDSTMDALVSRMSPYATGGTFLNFLTDTSRTPSAYTTEDYRRLLEVKRAWDPDNFFSHNHNIAAVSAVTR